MQEEWAGDCLEQDIDNLIPVETRYSLNVYLSGLIKVSSLSLVNRFVVVSNFH